MKHTLLVVVLAAFVGIVGCQQTEEEEMPAEETMPMPAPAPMDTMMVDTMPMDTMPMDTMPAQ